MISPAVSADSHICEPPDLWTSRLSSRWKDRAPRVIRQLEGRTGEFFVCEDIQPRSVFAASAAGVPSDELPRRAALGFDAAPPSVWDPSARLVEQDVDGVAAEVLFPTFADLLFGCRDAQFRRACFAAYNDFVAEYCATAPSRLIGVALVDDASVHEAVAELLRAHRQGLRAVVLRGDPEVHYGDTSFEEFWAAAVDLGVPVAIHRGAVRRDVTVDVHGALSDYVMIPTQAQRALTALVFCGVWERHPDLRLVLCEFDLMWLPHFLSRLARADERYGANFGLGLTRPAIDQVKHGVWITFQHETADVARLLDTWPRERLMWASDYPHADSTWPHSARVIAELQQAVGNEATRSFVHDTCVELYGIDLPAPAHAPAVEARR